MPAEFPEATQGSDVASVFFILGIYSIKCNMKSKTFFSNRGKGEHFSQQQNKIKIPYSHAVKGHLCSCV